MTEYRRVSAHMRTLASGRRVPVRESQRRYVGRGLAAGAAFAGTAVIAGAPVALVVLGVVLVGAGVAASRHPELARSAASTGLQTAATTASASREVFAELAEVSARRRRERKFERETMQTMRWLVDCEPELLKHSLELLRDNETPEEAFRCANLARQAVQRSGRSRELLARGAKVAEMTWRLYKRIEELGEDFEHFLKATPTDWVFLEPLRHRSNAGPAELPPVLDKLQEVAALHALGELSDGEVPEKVTRALTGPLDDLLAILLSEDPATA